MSNKSPCPDTIERSPGCIQRVCKLEAVQRLFKLANNAGCIEDQKCACMQTGITTQIVSLCCVPETMIWDLIRLQLRPCVQLLLDAERVRTATV